MTLYRNIMEYTMVKNIKIVLPENAAEVNKKTRDILKRQLETRSGVKIVTDGNGDFSVIMKINPYIGKEGYQIDAGQSDEIIITGNDDRGLLFGVGKFLRTSQYFDEYFIPSTWKGVSIPDKEIRGMYFATHFHNFYHDAPIEEVANYIEDIALWGFNAITVWFDMHHYNSINDIEAQVMIDRLHLILKTVREVGLGTGLLVLANEAYANSPENMRADWTSGHDGYKVNLQGHYHVELCPNKLGAEELILQWKKEVFERFSDIKLDYFWIWPYDEGGCTCSNCAPWGANGYIKIGKSISKIARDIFPQAKIILSTWYFDNFISGEWQAFAREFTGDSNWADYIMAENPMKYPEFFPLKNGVPGQKPLLGFPEISMYGSVPWGGFGANPLPCCLQSMWNEMGEKLSGGFPYSEGIYEDINKIICGGFYWDGNTTVVEILKEYISYEFSSTVVEEVLKAIELLEKANSRCRTLDDGTKDEYGFATEEYDGAERYVIGEISGIDDAYRIIQNADEKLSMTARNSWRWRILYLRSVIDYELANNGMKPNPRCEDAFMELIKIYHAEKTPWFMRPPTKRMKAIIELF